MADGVAARRPGLERGRQLMLILDQLGEAGIDDRLDAVLINAFIMVDRLIAPPRRIQRSYSRGRRDSGHWERSAPSGRRAAGCSSRNGRSGDGCRRRGRPWPVDAVALEALDEIGLEMVEEIEVWPRSAIAVARIDHHDEIVDADDPALEDEVDGSILVDKPWLQQSLLASMKADRQSRKQGTSRASPRSAGSRRRRH